MVKNVFSVPIFFILFRETLEAAIIVSVLLALAEQLVSAKEYGLDTVGTTSTDEQVYERTTNEKKLLRKLRVQIFAGAAVGLLVALAIGAAFIAIFYTKVEDLWAKSEDLWEGVFSLVAALMIWIMGITMLRMDRAKIKWRIKLQKAFNQDPNIAEAASQGVKQSKSGKYALFLLPMITVLREGLEAVVFLGGVSLGEPATSIPLAAVVGLFCGLIVGFLLYKSSSRLNMSIFLVGSTCFLLLIGAGLFSRSVGFFQTYKFVKLVGADVSESGSGPGSYSVHGVIWHLNCCNPEGNSGWSIFNAILGWTNNATVGTILAYVSYWLTCIATLIYMKWSEGRTTVLGRKSLAYERRQERKTISAQNHHVRTESSQPLYSPVDDSKKDDFPGTVADERVLPEIGRIHD